MARVLVIEDEVDQAEVLARSLGDEQHQVDVAYDGDDGLRRAETGVHALVILDLMLPDLDGIEICRQLRRRSLLTPILMLTARDTTADVVAGLDAGANDYVTKPFDLSVAWFVALTSSILLVFTFLLYLAVRTSLHAEVDSDLATRASAVAALVCSAGGAGLGLSIVSAIARQHRARLQLTSEVGRGTTVEVRFAAVQGRRDPNVLTPVPSDGTIANTQPESR